MKGITTSTHKRTPPIIIFNNIALFPFMKGITTCYSCHHSPTLEIDTPIALFPFMKGITTRAEECPNPIAHILFIALFPFMKGITTFVALPKMCKHHLLHCTISVYEGNYDIQILSS